MNHLLPSWSGTDRSPHNNSAGQVGPRSPEINVPSPTAPKDADQFGKYLFGQESFEEWSNLFAINTASIYFVTAAFLGLLEEGSQDRPGFTSNVINITSISGLIKLSQKHVCCATLLDDNQED